MARAQTSMNFERGSVNLAGAVASEHRSGTGLRARATGNERMRRANAHWNTLTASEADAWTLHGKGYSRRNPLSGTLYAPSAKNLLIGLSCKILQIDPHAELPRLPPEGTFLADELDVRVEPLGHPSSTKRHPRDSASLPVAQAAPER